MDNNRPTQIRWSILSILLLAGICLQGCTAITTPDAVSATPTPATANVRRDHEEDVVSTSDHKVAITFGSQEQERERYQPLIEAFNANNPDLQVQFVAIDNALRTPLDPQNIEAALDQRARAIAELADTTDHYPILPDLARRYALDLTPLLEGDAAFARDDFYSGVFEVVRHSDGGLYILPSAITVNVLSYNKDLFQRSGISFPDSNWTWADLRTTAARLARKSGDTVETYGVVFGGGLGLALAGELAAHDPALLTTPAEPVQFDRPAVVAALQAIAEMVDSGALYVADAERVDLDALTRLIRDGHVGMWTGGLIPVGMTTAFEIGTVALPALPPPSVGLGGGYVISAGTQHPDAAWRWLAWLSQQAAPDTTRGSDTSVRVPARRSIAERSGVWQQMLPDMAAAVRMTFERPQPPVSAASAWPAQLEPALRSVIQGEVTAEQAVDKLQMTLKQSAATPPSPTPEAGPISVATPIPAPAARATTIQFGVALADITTIRARAEAYHRQQQATLVQVQPIAPAAGASAWTELAQRYDCFVLNGIPSVDTAALLDLQPLIDADPTFPRADYAPDLLTAFQHNGRLVGLPYRIDLPALHYNPARFAEVGLNVPEPAWTIDDLQRAAIALSSVETDRTYGFASLAMPDDLRGWIHQAGASLVRGTGDTTVVTLTDPAVVAAVQSYLDLLQRASPHEQLTGYRRDGPSDDARELVRAGRVAMWLDSRVSFGGRSLIGAEILAPLPRLGAAPLPAARVTLAFYISAQTSHRDACWGWIRALSDDATGMAGGFPARHSIAESTTFTAQALPGAAAVYESYQNARDPQAAADSSVIIERSKLDLYWFYQAVDRALQGADLERELADAQFVTEQYLACVQGGEVAGTCARQVDPTYAGFAQP